MTGSYRVLITDSAERELKRLPNPDRSRISARILGLAENPRPPGCKKLKGLEGYRVRQGNYRILYTVQDEILVVDVYEISHRKESYR